MPSVRARKKNKIQPSAIPDKRYFTISEVSDICGEKAHVLRYWESMIPQLTPEKRKGGHRYYTQKDILLIQRISLLLREEGYTLAGVKQWLSSDKGKENMLSAKQIVSQLRADLEALLDEIRALL